MNACQCVILIFLQALVVIQDLLRVFVIRIACQNVKYASMLLQTILSSIARHVSESFPSDTDAYKVRILQSLHCLGLVVFSMTFLLYFQVLRLLDFLVSLSEHPLGKVTKHIIFFLSVPLFLFLIFITTILNCVVL